MQTIDREELLSQLESVLPGVSTRNVVEQSGCFIFQDGKVQTYNDEISCSKETALKAKGAVQASQLLELLRKLPGKTIEVDMGEGELLVFDGKRRKAGIRMEADIVLPLDQVETPDDSSWRRLNDSFCEAVGVVHQCASKDEGTFHLTCVHIASRWIEACDNYQITRFSLKTKFKEEALLRQEAMKAVGSLDVVEFSEGKSWVHFKNPSGLVISCRKYTEEFPDLSGLLTVENAVKVSLPEDLGDSIDTANIFSSANPNTDVVSVGLKNGRIILRGEGAYGWYRETKKIKYTGPDIRFVIPPNLLKDIVKRHRECMVNPERLLVNTGSFIYVTCLDSGEVEDKS